MTTNQQASLDSLKNNEVVTGLYQAVLKEYSDSTPPIEDWLYNLVEASNHDDTNDILSDAENSIAETLKDIMKAHR